MKNTSLFFLVLVVLLSFSFKTPKDYNKVNQINVVIDAGHASTDYGAAIDGTAEKRIIEELITKIQAFNKNKKIVFHFSRSTDMFISLEERTTFINTIKPDLVLSLHLNSSPNKNSSGMEFYVSKESESYEKSNLIAEKFQTKFLDANFKVSEIKNADFHILKKSEVPALIMELGNLTNENDKINLANNFEQNKIAKKIIECISELK